MTDTHHSQTIAMLNDRFRQAVPLGYHPKIPGRVHITPGIARLDEWELKKILKDIREYDFSDKHRDGNDPYGEHDFGAINHPTAGKIFWKIDYYDLDLTGGSENPADTSKTHRVMTIMLAEEY